MSTRELHISELERLLADDLVLYFIKEYKIDSKLYLFFAGYKGSELVSDINVPLIYRRWRSELSLYGMEIDSVYEVHKNIMVEYPNPVVVGISATDNEILILLEPEGDIQIKTYSERISLENYEVKIGFLVLECFLSSVFCDKVQFSANISELPHIS